MRIRVGIAALAMVSLALLAACGNGEEADSGRALSQEAQPTREAAGPGGEASPAPGAQPTREAATPIFVATGNAMAVDAVSGGDVDAEATVAGSAPFEVDIVISAAAAPYQGYQSTLRWDPAVLALDSQTDLKPEAFDLCASPRIEEGSITMGCVRQQGSSPFLGPIHTLTMHCLSAGESPLHLLAVGEGSFASSTFATAGGYIETELADATVICR